MKNAKSMHTSNDPYYVYYAHKYFSYSTVYNINAKQNVMCKMSNTNPTVKWQLYI